MNRLMTAMTTALTLNAMAANRAQPQKFTTGHLLLPWAEGVQRKLQVALTISKLLPPEERLRFLLDEVTDTLNAPNGPELLVLMHVSLYRGLKLITAIKETSGVNTKVQLAVLESVIHVAIDTHKNDLALPMGPYSSVERAQFGVRFCLELFNCVGNIADEVTRLVVMRNVLEMLNRDLSHDRDTRYYIPFIVAIEEALEVTPEVALNKEEALKHMKQFAPIIKKITTNLRDVAWTLDQARLIKDF